jgi:hypothetical protein
MKRLVLSLLFLALSGAVAQANDSRSGTSYLSGCRLVAEANTKSLNIESTLEVGRCIGAISSLLYVGSSLSEPIRFCPPSGVSINQAARVIMKFLDAKPEKLHEDFRGLAIEALRGAWPCR